MINRILKSALVLKFGTQVKAAKEIGIHPTQLSTIIGGREPNWTEAEKLMRVFGPNEMRRFFPKPKQVAANREAANISS
jgi:hypothetical protein